MGGAQHRPLHGADAGNTLTDQAASHQPLGESAEFAGNTIVLFEAIEGEQGRERERERWLEGLLYSPVMSFFCLLP